MHGGMGSFSDYCIWKEDFEERVRANQELYGLTDKLWRIFEL